MELRLKLNFFSSCLRNIGYHTNLRLLAGRAIVRVCSKVMYRNSPQYYLLFTLLPGRLPISYDGPRRSFASFKDPPHTHTLLNSLDASGTRWFTHILFQESSSTRLLFKPFWFWCLFFQTYSSQRARLWMTWGLLGASLTPSFQGYFSNWYCFWILPAAVCGTPDILTYYSRTGHPTLPLS